MASKANPARGTIQSPPSLGLRCAGSAGQDRAVRWWVAGWALGLFACGAAAPGVDAPTGEEPSGHHEEARTPTVSLLLQPLGDPAQRLSLARTQLLSRGIEPISVRAEGGHVVVEVAVELAAAAELAFEPGPEFFIAEVDEQWSAAQLPSFVRVDERPAWGGDPVPLRTAVSPPEDDVRLREALARVAPAGRRFVVGKNLLPPGTPDGAHGVLVHEQPIVTGADIREVELRDEPAATVVYVTFHEQAAAALRHATSGRTGFRIALVLDGRVIMAPVITGAIDQGQARLDPGDGSYQSAVRLADDLRRSGEEAPLRLVGRR